MSIPDNSKSQSTVLFNFPEFRQVLGRLLEKKRGLAYIYIVALVYILAYHEFVFYRVQTNAVLFKFGFSLFAPMFIDLCVL